MLNPELCTTQPDEQLQLSVIIPAKNEAPSIFSTLKALYDQVDADGKPLNKRHYELILLVNNCTDDTARIARQFAYNYPDLALHIIEKHFPPKQAHIGYVRRILMDEAFFRFSLLRRPRGVIASTDGDSTVGSTWIFYILKSFAEGLDAVGGRILTIPQSSDYRWYHLMDVKYRFLLARLETLIDPLPHDPWPKHFQFFGPSLAVSAKLYEQAGRLPVVPYLEDLYFYHAIQKVDARIRHCPQVEVYTSTRQQGRASLGFSRQLQDWASMRRRGELPEVAGAPECQFRLYLRNRLRTIWHDASYAQLTNLSQHIGVSLHEFYEQMISTCYFGTFLDGVMQSEKIQDYLLRHFHPVPIDQAIRQLSQQLPLIYTRSAVRSSPPTDPACIAHAAGDEGALAVG